MDAPYDRSEEDMRERPDLSQEDFERWLRDGFRLGTTHRDLYCNSKQAEMFRRLVLIFVAKQRQGFTITVKAVPCIKDGWAFLVDPASMIEVPYR